jgi:uncharacterized phage protein gp47/JayE
MPWNRQTLSELRLLARGYFAARLPGADATLRRSNIAVTSDVMAGMVNGVYGYQDYQIRQNFTDTAEGDYLLRKGQMFGMAPTPGTLAAGYATVTGLDTVEVPNDVVLFQDAQQNTYKTTAAVTIAGGTANVPIIATAGGRTQNLVTGSALQVIFAIAGINPAASVTAPGLTGGSDAEDPEAFRARVLARQAQPPQGGAEFDYVFWAKTVPGVTRAWTYPLNRGGGTVDLTFVMDGRDDIIPTVDDVAAVQAAIDAKRPVTDDCIVFAPIATAVDFEIETDGDATVQAAIIASVKDMFLAEAVPGGAYDPVTGTALSGGLAFQDHIDPAVAEGAGGVDFNIVAPNVDVAGSSGHILVPGDFTWS